MTPLKLPFSLKLSRPLFFSLLLLIQASPRALARELKVVTAPSVWQKQLWGQLSARMLATPRFLLLRRGSSAIECYDSIDGDKLWRYESKSSIIWPSLHGTHSSYPILYGMNDLFIATAKGRVIALDLETAEESWIFDAQLPILHPPISNGDLIFVTSEKDELIAIKGSNGREKWRSKLEGRQGPPPRASSSLVVLAREPRVVAAFDVNSGTRFWKRKLDASPRHAPLLLPGRLAWATEGGKLYIMDRLQGGIIHKISIKAPPLPSAAVIGTRILMASERGFCLSIDLLDGKILWSKRVLTERKTTLFSRKARLFNFSASKDLISFASLEDRRLICIDSHGGRLLWEKKKRRGLSIPPLHWGEYLFVAGDERSIECFDKRGRLLWQSRSRKEILSRPIVDASGVIYFATQGGELHAVRVSQ